MAQFLRKWGYFMKIIRGATTISQDRKDEIKSAVGALLDEIFAKTGALYEKYDVVTGKIGIGEAYGTPEMLGWTAGIYLSLQQYLETGKLI